MRGRTLTPPPPLGCWGLVAIATGCTLLQLPGPRVPAARLPEGHGLRQAAVLQLRDHVEVGAGRTEGGEEGLRTSRKRNASVHWSRASGPTGSVVQKRIRTDVAC